MKLTFPLLNTTINVPVDDTMAVNKKNRRAVLRNKKAEQSEKIQETIDPAEDQSAEKTGEIPETEATPVSSDTAMQGLLMVEVVNVTHEKFRQTEEIKVKLYIILYIIIS